jgi:SCY1-like protein 1
VDEEPAIRTNTTILLGNIASHLNEAVSLFIPLLCLNLVRVECLAYCRRSLTTLWISTCLQTRKRVLINAFTVRALRDGFAPARGAGTISPLNLVGGVFCQRNVVMIQLVTLATGSCSPH